MRPKRKQRMMLIGLLITGVGGAVALSLLALEKNVNLFFSPTQIAAGEAPTDVTFRLGGLVKMGSVRRSDNDLNISFTLTDTAHNVDVSYNGILPDLFREGQGIVTMGTLVDGRFVAREVLAKHDENYMPPEVSESLEHAKLANSTSSDIK